MKKVSSKVINQSSTLFLRLAIMAIGLVVLGLSTLVAVVVRQDWASEFPDVSSTTYPIIFCIAMVVITFFVALYHGWKILNLIDKNKVFSLSAVKALHRVKFCLFVIAGLFMAGWPIIAYLAELDDAPGLILIYGAIFIGAPTVFAVGLAVLQRLLQSAIAIKSENDLTV